MIRFVPANTNDVSGTYQLERRPPWPPTGPEAAQAQIDALTARIASLEAKIARLEVIRRTDDSAQLIRQMLDRAEQRIAAERGTLSGG